MVGSLTSEHKVGTVSVLWPHCDWRLKIEKEGVSINDGVGQDDIPAEQAEMDLALLSRESRTTQLKGSAGSIKRPVVR